MDYLDNLDIKHFLSSSDISKQDTLQILELAHKFKKNEIEVNVGKKSLGLIFEKASTRTRVSFQVAMSRLGGNSIDLNPDTAQIKRGEPIKDTARVLGRYFDVLAVRAHSHNDLKEYAKWSNKPVINALTNLEHPCQALADYLTIKEEFGDFKNISLTFIGDGNNVAHSLMLCGSLLEVNIRIACPLGFEPDASIISKVKEINPNANLLITNDIEKSIKDSHILYTDVWSSMGEENNKLLKDKSFHGYTICKNILDKARGDAIVMHCLPAYRGKEITDEIMECSQSRIFNQAENRMHAQQALLAYLLK